MKQRIRAMRQQALLKTRLIQKGKKRLLIRSKALLYKALSCIYLQDNDDLHITLGRETTMMPDKYRNVLTEAERFGVFVTGYMTQGLARKPPTIVDRQKLSEAQYRTKEHIAAHVHGNWLLSHLLINPKGTQARLKHAVALTRRSADTLCEVSLMIGQAALDLAAKLKITDQVLRADEKAEMAIVPEHPMQASIPRVPWPMSQWLRTDGIDAKEMDEAHTQFQKEVLDVFSFHLCISENNWIRGDEVMISTTGLRKRYSEMTPKERKTSGSVVLRNIMRDLCTRKRVVRAIQASLVASRALERIARKLLKACDAL